MKSDPIAVQWNSKSKNFDEVMNFVREFHGNKFNYENAEEYAYKTKKLIIRGMIVSDGDWIVKEPSGELYVCKSEKDIKK